MNAEWDRLFWEAGASGGGWCCVFGFWEVFHNPAGRDAGVPSNIGKRCPWNVPTD